MQPWHLAFVVIPFLVLLHLYISPFTKVEESFNMQATHDILTYGVPSPWDSNSDPGLKFASLYDHVKFPGAVPRTFLGSLFLSALAAPFVWWGTLSLPEQQVLVRAILGLLNAAALFYYTVNVQRAFGKSTAGWFVFLLTSQFHVFYYASRTLPNMFAFALSTVALALLLLNNSGSSSVISLRPTRLAFYILTLATVVFRSELALLIASEACNLLIFTPPGQWVQLITRILIPAGATGLVAGLILTVGIDTYFWRPAPFPQFLRHPLWPELAAFLSNVFPKDGLGASAWGTSPWHWYFTSALPRLFLNPALIPLRFYSLATSRWRDALKIAVPAIVYTALYSLLAHKETRFMFPIIPPLTLLAALGASQLSIAAQRSNLANLAKLVLVATTILTGLVAHGILLPLSALTYPGGHALLSLHSLSTRYGPQRQINVHLTNLALQTGVTHFLEMPVPESPLVVLPGSPDGKYPELRTGGALWIYDKTDNSSTSSTSTSTSTRSSGESGAYNDRTFWDQFDYVIVEDPSHPLPNGGGGAWDVIDKIAGLGGKRTIGVLRPNDGRGTLVLGGGGGGGGRGGSSDSSTARHKDGIAKLIENMYEDISPPLAAWAVWGYGIVHDVLREGCGIGGKSLTGGYWMHWGPEWTLYVMRRGGERTTQL